MSKRKSFEKWWDAAGRFLAFSSMEANESPEKYKAFARAMFIDLKLFSPGPTTSQRGCSISFSEGDTNEFVISCATSKSSDVPSFCMNCGSPLTAEIQH